MAVARSYAVGGAAWIHRESRSNKARVKLVKRPFAPVELDCRRRKHLSGLCVEGKTSAGSLRYKLDTCWDRSSMARAERELTSSTLLFQASGKLGIDLGWKGRPPFSWRTEMRAPVSLPVIAWPGWPPIRVSRPAKGPATALKAAVPFPGASAFERAEPSRDGRNGARVGEHADSDQ